MTTVTLSADTPSERRVYRRYDPTRVVGRMTLDEYALFDRGATERHEFIAGEVVRVAGGSPEHNLICANALRALGNALEAAGAPCDVVGSDQRVFVDTDRILYPDVTVVCGSAQYDPRDALRNPLAIIEVLSPTTEREDRTDKFRDYQRIVSLRHYILIEQNRPSVTHFEKLAQGLWAITGDYTDMAAVLSVSLGEVNVAIPLSTLYRHIAFPSPDNE